MGSAILSPCGMYRYHLRRDWSVAPPVVWIMLNPSTADAEQDDPTIRRCMSFARAWWYGGIEVVNLFALRSSNPRDLIDSHEAGIDVVGPDNDEILARVFRGAQRIVAAWGAHRFATWRAREVVALARAPLVVAPPLMCLGTTKSGAPRHPLYVHGSARLVPFQPIKLAEDSDQPADAMLAERRKTAEGGNG